jgi:RNA polymerase sigma factor (sigma-70 family)
MNRIRDLIRVVNRRGTDVKLESDPKDWAPSPLEEAIMRQQLDRFLEALGRLRPSDRQVIVWRIELGYTADEIAGKLGKSRAAAGMTVSRAMDKLARELDLETPVSE